jgi:hypothetical protein
LGLTKERSDLWGFELDFEQSNLDLTNREAYVLYPVKLDSTWINKD